MSDQLVPAVVVIASAAAAVIDLRTRRVPNALTGAVAIVAVALAATGAGTVGVGAALAGGLLGLLFMLPGHLLGATGAGDVKLLAAFGALLGPRRTLTAFAITAIAGGAIALVVAIRRRRLAQTVRSTTRLVATRGASAGEVEDVRADNRFAYAPAIAIGATLAAIAG